MSEVWCGKCERPATREIRLTTGEKVARCDDHAWLLIAPRGGRPKVR